jgi:hypothetical protein
MHIALSAALTIFALLIAEHAHGAEAICSHPAVIFCEDFEQGDLAQWEDGYDPARHQITSAATNVYHGQRALEVTYPAGGDGGWLTRWFMPGYEEVHARVYVQFEQDWQASTKLFAFYGNRLDNRWSGFGKAGMRPNGTDFFYTALITTNWYRQPDPGEVIFYAYFPDMQQSADGMFWGNVF